MTTADKIADALRKIAPKGMLMTEDIPSINLLARNWDSRKPAEMSLSNAGYGLIKHYEGCILVAYKDAVGVWTIGYGHTGDDVKPGMKITLFDADELLRKDVNRFENAVRKLCPVTTQNQFDALVSFAFNLGEGALKESTLRRKHNDGDYAGAATEFLRWNKAGGKVLSGLTKRRQAESDLYRSQ